MKRENSAKAGGKSPCPGQFVTERAGKHRMGHRKSGRRVLAVKEEQEMLERAMHDKKTGALLGNRKKLGELLSAPETRKLMELLEKRSGGNLKSAAQSAAKGDPETLMALMREVMEAQEGAEAVEQLKKKIP